MPNWLQIASYASGFVFVVGGILWLNKAIKTGEDRWQSYLKRIDRKVIDYMEQHARTAQTEGSKSRTVDNICKATRISEKHVTKSLDRLRRDHKVREHGENWFLV
jgi:hypothetical protein